ncbi:uncharacterized protein LOC144146919 [Haemaphysalis longicornis]
MRRLKAIGLLFGLLVAQRFEVTLAKPKTGGGGQSSSGFSPSGTGGASAASGVGEDRSRTSSASTAAAGSAGGARSAPGSGGLSTSPTGPSNDNAPTTDDESGGGFGGIFGGSYGSGSQGGIGPLYHWFNGPGGGSHRYRGPFVPPTGFPSQSGSYGVRGGFGQPAVSPGFFGESGEGGFGSLGNGESSDFWGRPGYQNRQGGQSGPNVFGGPFGRGSFGSSSGFGNGFAGFDGPWSQGTPSGTWNVGGSNIPGDEGFLSESSGFGSGYLDALSGLSDFGNEGSYSGGVGQVRGSRRTRRFGKRLLALLPVRSRRNIRLYLKYKKRGFRGSFFQFLRKLKTGTLRGFAGDQGDSWDGFFGSSSERYGSNFGQQRFSHRPSLWSQGSYGSSWGRGAGFGGAFGNDNDAFSQQGY